ncbi:MAG: hypothetical protein ACJ746_05305 [Bryobacteraceae bacterium]
MKVGLMAAVAASLSVTLCSGAPCVSGSLSSYIALAGGGCTIGTNSLFNFQVVSGTTGGTEIAAVNVLLSPLGGAVDPGLNTSVNGTATSGSVLETLFTYQISGNAYTSAAITLSNSSESGNGSVTGLSDLCLGGTFGSNGVTGCTGIARALATVDGAQNQDSATFSPAFLLSVTNDLTIDSGITGTATGGTLTNRFTAMAAVPEPVTALLTVFGLIFAAAARKNPATHDPGKEDS